MSPLPDLDGVNPHYLDHVVAAGSAHDVEASEDILASNGIKLLAKGARVDADVRDRLLQHKLGKPLEDCVQVVGGGIVQRFRPVAEEVLDRYALLRTLCAGGAAHSAAGSLSGLGLSAPLCSLITVYAEHQPGRIEHTVGVALLAAALGRRLRPGDVDRHRVLATAGLVHDVGELYIDPAYLRKGTALDAQQWRHIVTHPLIAHRVLADMAGAGQAVAQAVLQHHERLDGFGYPHGIAGERFTLDGQILAVSEWLMALVESGVAPMARASMATRLVPGEFSLEILQEVAAAARAGGEALKDHADAWPMEGVAERVDRIAQALARFHASRPWLEQTIAGARPPLQAALQACLQRMLRIQASFVSTGLDCVSGNSLVADLDDGAGPQAQLEVITAVRELEWRLREIERESRLRVGLLDAEAAVVEEVVARLSGRGAAAPL